MRGHGRRLSLLLCLTALELDGRLLGKRLDLLLLLFDPHTRLTAANSLVDTECI
jgi:hypothetical protein